MKVVKKLFALLNKNDKKRGFKTLLIFIIHAFVEVSGAAAIFPLLIVLLDNNLVSNYFFINQISSVFYTLGIMENVNQNIFLISILLFLTLIILIIRIFAAYCRINFLETTRYSISKRLLYSYLSQKYEFFINKNSNEMAKNLLAEVDEIVAKVLFPLTNMIAQVIVGSGLLIFLYVLNFRLALSLTIFTGLLYILFYLTLAKQLKKIGLIRRLNQTKRFISANEILIGIKSIMINNSEKYYSNKFIFPNKIFTRMNTLRSLINETPAYIIESLALISLILYSLFIIINNGSTKTESIALIGLYGYTFLKLKPAINSVFSGLTGLKYGENTINKIFHDLKLSKKASSQNKEFSNIKNLKFEKEILMKNVYYKYSGNKNFSLKEINFRIHKGQTIGIVGTTGCGKTTLSNILLGLFEPTNGKVFIDNIELNLRNSKEWQKNIGYVSQDLFMLDSSISENIAFGRKLSTSNKDLIKIAARKAKINKFIENNLDKSYETIVGDNGVKLSGGEKQRLAIARALYNDPQIIIFDEATSSLDQKTEKEVMKEIKNFSKNKTLIMIAHRLNIVKDCDLIFLLNNGSIEAKGTYEELKNSDNSFSKMLKQK